MVRVFCAHGSKWTAQHVLKGIYNLYHTIQCHQPDQRMHFTIQHLHMQLFEVDKMYAYIDVPPLQGAQHE